MEKEEISDWERESSCWVPLPSVLSPVLLTTIVLHDEIRHLSIPRREVVENQAGMPRERKAD